MKKIHSAILVLILTVLCATGCGSDSELNADDPVTLTMWHVYGEQADSPMNHFIDEFNKTIGKERGIVIDVTMITNSAQVGGKLLEAQQNSPGAPDMPDLFFCHSNNAAALGAENLINWKDYFDEESLNRYAPDFVNDGMVGDSLAVFPVSKSTHLLFVAGTPFDRFSAATGVTYHQLSTWEGFFDAAAKYYEWSGGKAFCAFDYLIRAIELNAMGNGASKDFYTDDGWYDFSNDYLKASYMEFAESIAKGHIVVSDMYANTQVMTGEVICGMGSSASILYYNDTITYEDNTKEPTNLKILPAPQPKGGKAFMTQAGVGLCTSKTTAQKAEAAEIFVRWFTEEERNVSFAAETGYMPVCNGFIDKISGYEFQSENYKNLYTALANMRSKCTAVSEPSFVGYYDKISVLYDALRSIQPELEKAYSEGEDISLLKDKTWSTFTEIN